MKRKLTILFVLALTFCLVLAFSSCGGSADTDTDTDTETEEQHVHTYENSYTCTVCGETLVTSDGLKYTLSDDGTYYTVTGKGTFTDKDLVIPNTYNGLPVKSIGAAAFLNSYLTSVTIPNSITSIEGGAFAGYHINSINYLGDVEGWCNIAFGVYVQHKLYLNGELLTELVIPDTVTEIKNSAFGSCSSLTSVTIPDSVTSIGDDAFEDCRKLASVTIGNGVTSIGSSAFGFCSSLTSITIPDSVTSIGRYAFDSSKSLTTVIIGDNVTSIGFSAFSQCDSLASVTFENTSGWYVTETYGAESGTDIDVTNPSTNAKNYLTSYPYLKYYWYRK